MKSDIENTDITPYDATSEKAYNKAKLSSEREFLSAILQSIGDAVIITDTSGRVIIMNKTAEMITAWKQEEVLGKMLGEVFKTIRENTDCTDGHYFEKMLKTGIHFENTNNTILISKNGTKKVIESNASSVKSKKGDILGMVIIFRDVTERHSQEKKIKYLSFHDKLTDLYNRAFFEEEMKRLDTTRQLPLTLIIGDVNGLKLTNDIFGHEEGDRLLKKIARILKESCRDDDIIARWGGDEFTMILSRTCINEASEICNRINEACSKAGMNPIQPSISLGCAVKNDMSQDIRQILKDAEDQMYKHKLLECRNIRNSILSSLKRTLFERSYETEEHTQRLQKLSEKIGHAIGLSKNEMDELELLAILHDIGKIAIPDKTLMKKEELTELEWKEMKKHTEIGFRIADSAREISHVADYILHHHEWWDGSGYPDGLKGAEIPKLSRILMIIDSYDVITHDKPYKKAVTHLEAIEKIKKGKGIQYDPEFVDIFVEMEGIVEQQGC